MNLLVTAGNTLVLIDKVRCLTNIFTGRTGAAIALEAYRRGHNVTLLTSHPDTVRELKGDITLAPERWRVFQYMTLGDLEELLEMHLTHKECDGLVHSAAVNDYNVAGIFAPAPGTRFEKRSHNWHTDNGTTPALVYRGAGKVKSDEPELWLRLVRAPKLIDKVRADWGFQGILVKFKLEVGVTDEQLLEIAENARAHSQADLMVANIMEEATETASSWVYLGPLAGGYKKISRPDLPTALVSALENMRR